MAMNKNLQIHLSKQKLEKIGVTFDILDLKHLIDGTLTFPENWRLIQLSYIKEIEELERSKALEAEQIDFQDHYVIDNDAKNYSIENVKDMKIVKHPSGKVRVRRFKAGS